MIWRSNPKSTPADPWAELRAEMVARHVQGQGISDPRVLRAMQSVPRHLFAPHLHSRDAYTANPLPIGDRQTVSAPYIVGLMTEQLDPKPSDRILEVGTGSGYQAAVLAWLAASVHSIEIDDRLARQAAQRLRELKLDNVTVISGDGYSGVPEHAPYDGIMVTAAVEAVPPPLLDQIAPGGRLLAPIGPDRGDQWLHMARRDRQGRLIWSRLIQVRFVPFVRAV